MDIFELEKARFELINILDKSDSNRRRFFAICNYYNNILSNGNYSLGNAFIPEFLELYLNLFNYIDPNYFDPEISRNIIRQIELIGLLDFSEDISAITEKLLKSKKIFEQKLKILENNLAGIDKKSVDDKVKFPIVEELLFGEKHIYGFLESFTISITKNNVKDNFIVIPSGINLEVRLEKQLNICWNIALKYLKKYIRRPAKFHEIMIAFDNKAGNYSGDSLGIALTISFIKELLSLYNSDYLINTKPGISITGGLNEEQNVIAVSDEIIKEKTEIVFYSDIETFVLPKDDEESAKHKYQELKINFSNRNLKIIGIENLDDLLNRRNIIDIKKQSFVKKSSRSLKNNWKISILILLLSFTVGYFFYRDWDDNPAILESNGNTLLVKNKSGRVLWETRGNYNYFEPKLIDIDSDEVNEVILTNEFSNPLKITCYNKDKVKIWDYAFNDTISTYTDKLDKNYGSFLIDTATINNNKVILCLARNIKSFSSAVYQLDLKTGKRVNSTLWNSGFFVNALISDFDNDGNKELCASFCNNGYEQVGILLIEIDKLFGQCPTTPEYKYKKLAIADLEQYILFPKTDYTRYLNNRIEGIPEKRFHFTEKKDRIYIGVELEGNIEFNYFYEFKNKKFEIMIGNNFRARRDSLVVSGKLKPPLTDTEEYSNILISQIKYWNGKEFVYTPKP